MIIINTNYEYYLFKIHVDENIIKDNTKVKVLFKEIVLYSKVDDISFKITGRDSFIEISQDRKTILLYVENSLCKTSHRIDYLFDDDYELIETNIDVIYNENPIEFNLCPMEQLLGTEIYNDFLFGFLSKQFLNETCCFTGHRPDKLYGYNLGDKRYQTLAKIIREECVDLIENYNVNTFISGGALGMDTVSFFTVEYLKTHGYPNLKNIVAIPFEKCYTKWKDSDLDRYRRMLKLADYVIIVDEIDGYENSFVAQGEYHVYKLNKRNEFMVDFSSQLIALWNGSPSGTYNCISYAEYNKRIVHMLNVPGITRVTKEKEIIASDSTIRPF